MIFMPERYLILIETFLNNSDITFHYHKSSDTYKFGIDFSEYVDDDDMFISIATESPIRNEYISSWDHEIVVKDDITILTLYRELCAAYHAYNWYNDVADITPESILIDLDKLEIEDLLSGEIVKQEEIDNAITKLGGSAFVRLYSLSPKSAVSIPSDLVASNADEVCKLLRVSERTSNTLGLYLRDGIMLRKFISDLNTDNEFRLFIFDNRLRAISQYKCYECIDKYANKELREAIYQRICDWWEENNKATRYRDLVVDIAFVNDFNNVDELANSRIILIEINSYGGGLLSGSGLFNWLLDYNEMHYLVKPVIRFKY